MFDSIKVLLVDDHVVVRAGYRRLLEQNSKIEVIAEAGSAEQGYQAFCEHQPDVSVIDLSMPGMGGFELIRRILNREPSAALLVFSMHEESLFARRALEAGALGYITKNSAPDILVEAVQRVALKNIFLSLDVTHQFTLRDRAHKPNPLNALSAKEFEVFRLLAEGRSIAEVAQALHLSHKTVANYQTQIKQKLGITNTTSLVHLAIQHGVIKVISG